MAHHIQNNIPYTVCHFTFFPGNQILYLRVINDTPCAHISPDLSETRVVKFGRYIVHYYGIQHLICYHLHNTRTLTVLTRKIPFLTIIRNRNHSFISEAFPDHQI